MNELKKEERLLRTLIIANVIASALTMAVNIIALIMKIASII